MIVANIAHWLSTPYTIVRTRPLSEILRMHEQVVRLAK